MNEQIIDAHIWIERADQAETEAGYRRLLDPTSARAEELIIYAAHCRKVAAALLSREVEVHLRGEDEDDIPHRHSA